MMVPSALWDSSWAPLQWGIALGAAFIAAVLDVRTGRIPNALCGPLWAIGLACAFCTQGFSGAVDAILAGLLLMLPYVLLFLFGSGGAGDAKLMAGLGAWLGTINGLFVLGSVALCGVVAALVIALAHRRLRETLRRVFCTARTALYGALALRRLRGVTLAPAKFVGQKMPYGPAIFAGVCTAAAGVQLWRG